MLNNEVFMTAQYPTINDDPMLQIKLDWMDAIKVSEPKDAVIPIQIKMHDDIVISSKIKWKGSMIMLFAEYAALFIFCKDTFKPKMSKSLITKLVSKNKNFSV